MLLAEIHGKYDLAVRDHEDYLTSTVFGHLRYVAPGPFWMDFLSRAKTVPIDGAERSFVETVGSEHEIGQYDTLNVHFWPRVPNLGEPELALCFSGGEQRPLVVLVEVKLWSFKSGYGEYDQLMRYLRIADIIDRLQPAVPKDSTVVVLYLTPREALNEVQESLNASDDTERNRRRLFRLQWQDMVDAIDSILLAESQFHQRILADVQDFLKVRQLEYFRGFRISPDAFQLSAGVGSFFSPEGLFGGFHAVPSLNQVTVINAEW